MNPYSRESAFMVHLRQIVAQLRASGWDVEVMDHDVGKTNAVFVDFFAQRDEETLIGVLASRRSVTGDWFERLPQLAKELPNARVQVYWLGDFPENYPDVGDVQALLAEAQDVFRHSRRAGFLLAWAGLEGAIAAFASRLILQVEDVPTRSRELLSVLYSLGHVDETDFNRLTLLWRLRNQIAHEVSPAQPTHQDLMFVLATADLMATGLYVSADALIEWFRERYEASPRQESPGKAASKSSASGDASIVNVRDVLARAFPHAPAHAVADAVGMLIRVSTTWIGPRSGS